MFDYDWFFGAAFQQQQDEATWRCAARRYSEVPAEELTNHAGFAKFRSELEIRRLVYLRDGFSYELKDLADVNSKTHLTFECEPVDEHYKVGAFVVCVPFEDIVRVEVFAVHPNEKPEDMPFITGFQHRSDMPPSPVPPRDGGKSH